MIEFSKASLEAYVPALRSATIEVSERVKPFFIQAFQRIASALGFAFFGDVESIITDATLEQLVYIEAAYRAVSSIDLVATATGFAVVNNQNVAPASAHRVVALREDLRMRTSELRDQIIEQLRIVGQVPQGFIRSLFYCPSLCRTYGITKSDGALVYDEEYIQLLTDIRSAEAQISKKISHELMQALIARLYEPEQSPIYASVTDTIREAVAAIVMGRQTNKYIDNCLAVVNTYADELEEYKNSATYRAYKNEPYENYEESPAFFFSSY